MKKIILLLNIILAYSLIYSCESPDNNKTAKTISKTPKSTLSEGFHLLENNCFSCHSPNPSIENKIAPSIAEIKKHYIYNNPDKEQFLKDMLSFLNSPSEENSKMLDAVKKFGIMPKMSFNETQFLNIAQYIYDTEIENIDWFNNHYEEEKKKYTTNSTSSSPLEQGLSFALQTKAVLGKNLLTAINSKGTENALDFCSSKAYPLTDSMALELNVKIKRVSDKNRNPKNNANKEERSYILKSKNLISKGEKPTPQITELEKRTIGYYPIMTNKMCLQCHGKTNKEILPKTLSKINTLYPEDKATGYGINELRGIWVIEMNK